MTRYADMSERGRAVLRAIFEAGFAVGSGRSRVLPSDAELLALIDAVEADWFSLLACAARDPSPAIPDWLTALAAKEVE